MSSQTNDQKVTKILEKVMKIINKGKLTVPELIVFYGNLGYHIGASVAGFEGTGKGPTLEELKKIYYSNPTVDVGLMLQGLLITAWEEDYLKKPQLTYATEQGDKKEQK